MKKSKTNWRNVFELFSSFFRIGLFTFGGGYAMIPLIEREAVEAKRWIKSEDILDILAIAESTPGPLAINSATFVGYKVAGIWGSVAATFGVVLPSFIIITILSMFIAQIKENPYVDWAFRGIRAGVIVLMINATMKLGKACPKSAISFGLIAITFVLSTFTGINIVLLLIGAAILGILYQTLWVEHKVGGAR